MEERIYIKNNNFLPIFDDDQISKRAFSLNGMSKKDFMYNNLTVGLEYVRNALTRIFKTYEEIGRFGNRITSRNDFYQAMINTSMICWMNLETGHIEFTNFKSVYNNTEIINIPYCRIELDHEVSHGFHQLQGRPYVSATQ